MIKIAKQIRYSCGTHLDQCISGLFRTLAIRENLLIKDMDELFNLINPMQRSGSDSEPEHY